MKESLSKAQKEFFEDPIQSHFYYAGLVGHTFNRAMLSFIRDYQIKQTEDARKEAIGGDVYDEVLLSNNSFFKQVMSRNAFGKAKGKKKSKAQKKARRGK